MTKRMYKIEITEIPAECDEMRLVMCADGFVRMTRDWKPEGWDEYVAKRIAGGANWAPDQHFFWPSETKMYLSRRSAQAKADIVERWGGKARVLEAELSEFIPVEEANRKRKQARNAKTIAKLRARIAEIEGRDVA